MQLSQVLVFVAAAVASVNALATPIHGAHHRGRHINIAKARAPAPAPEPAIQSQFVSKRGLKKRCKPRTSTSSLAIPSGVGNVGGAPTSSAPAAASSSPAAVSSSVEASPSPAPQTPSPSPEPAPSSSQAPSQAPAPAPTTSSTPAPAPTTSSAPAPPPPAPTTSSAPAPPPPAPTTSSTPAPPPPPAPTTSAQPAPSSGGNNSGLGQFAGTMTGQGTWYDTGLTACGVTNNDGQFIAAVSHLMFDTFPGYNGVNPNTNPICGKQAAVTYQGKSITVTITDRCTGCAINDLDFTPTAFQQLAPLGAGRIDGVTWHFM